MSTIKKEGPNHTQLSSCKGCWAQWDSNPRRSSGAGLSASESDEMADADQGVRGIGEVLRQERGQGGGDVENAKE